MFSAKKIIIFLLISIGSVIITGCGEDSSKTQGMSSEMSEGAKKYDGKIVKQPSDNRGKQDGWFLVKNGKRSWIIDGSWLAKNGYQSIDVIEISSQQFNSIPEDPQPTQ